MTDPQVMKQLTEMINNVMGQRVLSEQQLAHIMNGAKKAHERGGMPAVIQYLMKVTQADVNPNELLKFADQVKENPQYGMDILKGKKRLPKRKK